MLRVILILLLFFVIYNEISAQSKKYEVEIVTSIESLVRNGVGRSRIISTKMDVEHLSFTSHQSEAKKDRNRSNRKDIRVKDFEETKLLNFYNEGGIRFQNIASNDALVTSKINSMLTQGWDLFFVETGVESKMIDVTVKKELLKMGIKALLNDDTNSVSEDDPNGLFMTRYYFRKEVE